MTDKPPAMLELPEPELGYIETDKSRQPAFSARQMREALQAAQPAAAVSDEAIYAVWTQHCQTPGTTTRQLVCAFARAILTQRPQSVPMTPASRAVIMATRTADGDADEWPEPWAYRRGWNDAEEHHHIRPNAEAK